MRHQSILEYARFRWLKGALWLSVACAAVYIWHDPPLKPYGGTWLGYTLGTIGAGLILWLTALGYRKRKMTSDAWSLKPARKAMSAMGKAVPRNHRCASCTRNSVNQACGLMLNTCRNR